MEGSGGENGMNSLLSHSHSQMSLEAEDHHHHHQHHQHQNGHNFGHETQNDFFEQILSSAIPNWPVSDNPKSGDSPSDGPDGFRHQINGASAAVKSMLLQQQQQQLHSALLPLPLSLGTPPDNSVDPSPFKSQGGGDAAVQALFNGFTGSVPNQQQHFHPGSAQNYGGQAGAGVMNQGPPTSASTGGGGSNGTASQKQNKPRARRGQATDPHSIAERLRRERIAERMKALQELVPNANKTDKASMLDEIIDYVKFLQLQVKVLSMSRLGGAGAVGPLVADMASERLSVREVSKSNFNSPILCKKQGGGGRGNQKQTAGASSTNEQSSMTVTEHQVAKLMEEDMGSAMQYLQGKGLCLMPISLATAISTATCHSRNPLPPALTRAALLNNLTNNGNHTLDNTTTNNNGNDPTSSNSNILPPPSSPTPSRD